MKRKTNVRPPIKRAERKRLERLINLAVEKYQLQDIIDAFSEAVDNWRDRETVVNCLLQYDSFKQEFKDVLEPEILQSKIVIEINSLADQMKLQDFLCAEIFPYYNQQQRQLFA